MNSDVRDILELGHTQHQSKSSKKVNLLYIFYPIMPRNFIKYVVLTLSQKM